MLPLYVDLDGTFVKADLLLESFISALKKNPLVLFFCIYWLVQGIATLKARLAELAEIDVSLLPLNVEFYDYLLDESAKGREIILATAANEKFAKAIVSHYPVFTSFISSSEGENLKGSNKLKKILEYGNKFAYAGNHQIDFKLFSVAAESILVNPSRKAKKLAQNFYFNKVFDEASPDLRIWLTQIRVHQWLKNLLIFVPLIVSGSYTEFSKITLTFIAFLAFSSLASSTYILNDLLDLPSDRNHSRKKNRPLASGRISLVRGGVIMILLFVLAFILSNYLSFEFLFILFCYLAITLAYSFKIKQYVGMDVVTLAILYTVRILAGAAAIGVITSFWLFAFSVFIFLSLALVKRCSEIKLMSTEGKNRATGRDYTINDYGTLQSLGTASAMLAVLMFCFYVNNNALNDQYQEPSLLWAIVPGLIYWIMRMWIKTDRGEMHDDPIVFSIRDKGSLITIAFCGLVTLMAQLL